MYIPNDIIKQVIMTCLEVQVENISMSEAKSRFSEYLSRAASGERFVTIRRITVEPESPKVDLILIRNWFTELEELMRGRR